MASAFGSPSAFATTVASVPFSDKLALAKGLTKLLLVRAASKTFKGRGEQVAASPGTMTSGVRERIATRIFLRMTPPFVEVLYYARRCLARCSILLSRYRSPAEEKYATC